MFQSLRSKGDEKLKDGEQKTDSKVVIEEPRDNRDENATVSLTDWRGHNFCARRKSPFNIMQSLLQRLVPPAAATSTYERILSYENVASPIEPAFGNNQYASMR